MRICLLITLMLAAPSLSACVTFDPDNIGKGTFVATRPALSGDQCDGSVLISTSIHNDIDDSLFDPSDINSKHVVGISELNISSDIFQVVDDRISINNAFVSQSAPDTCYAAALASIWKASGTYATEDNFRNAVLGTCHRKKSSGANFEQIMSAAYYAHNHKPAELLKTGKNYSNFVAGYMFPDGNGNQVLIGAQAKCILTYLCVGLIGATKLKPSPSSDGEKSPSSDVKYTQQYIPLSQPLYMQKSSPLQGLEWSSASIKGEGGGIYRLNSSSDLIYWMKKGAFILSGSTAASYGHVLIVNGITYSKIRKKILTLRIVDPALPDNNATWIDIGEGGTLSELKFALAVWNI